MGTFKNFTEIACWQVSIDLYQELYEITKLPEVRRNKSLVDQLRRAALSISNNIAEGFGRHTDKEFLMYLNISKGSCLEVESMIYLMDRIKLISVEQRNRLLILVIEVRKTIGGLAKYLSRSLKP